MGCKCNIKKAPICPRCNTDYFEYKESVGYCNQTPSCGCWECQPKCEDPCNIPSQELDLKEIFYKIKSRPQCFSELDELGISVGDDLEYIIEKFGKMLIGFNYFDLTNNIYGARSFSEFMSYIQGDIAGINQQINQLCAKIDSQEERITALTTRINKLENPQINDTKGLGFTIYSNIFTVLQSLANK